MSLSLTCKDSACDPWDAIDLGDVVVGKVVITGGIQELRVTEHTPELGSDSAIAQLDGLGTYIKPL